MIVIKIGEVKFDPPINIINDDIVTSKWVNNRGYVYYLNDKEIPNQVFIMDNKEFITGAVRSKDAEGSDYWLITPTGLDYTAREAAILDCHTCSTNYLIGRALNSAYDFLKEPHIDHISKASLFALYAIENQELLASANTISIRDVSSNAPRYDLLPPKGIHCVAEVYTEGKIKYSAYNWEKGMPCGDLLNHAIRHHFIYLSGDRSENHLGHAAWGYLAAIHSFLKWPNLNMDLRDAEKTVHNEGN